MPHCFTGGVHFHMPNQPVPDQPISKGFSDRATILFVIVLSIVSASILAILSSALQKPQESARELDRSKQLLLSAQIFNYKGYLQLNVDGKVEPAKQVANGYLEPTKDEIIASQADILAVYRARVRPMLVNKQGAISTYEEQHLEVDTYLTEHKKTGFSQQDWLPIFFILPNPTPEGLQPPSVKPEGYVIPISGYGLWDFIGGYLAIKPDGKTVIGISWYEQKETPGLGANIAEADWQSQFPGKQIFLADSTGQIDMSRAQIGITVVRGKVSDVLGSSPKALSSVDGMAGATLTGNGVTRAYKDTLESYRNFFEILASEKPSAGGKR